jgi:hypothetical protein
MTELINPKVTFHDDVDHPLIIKKDQEITDEFLQGTADARLQSTQVSGEFHRFASIPVAVVEKWMREGFDVLNGKHSAKEILAKLRSEDLGSFITTTKRL